MGKILDAIGGAALAIQQRAAVVALDEKFADMEAEITALKAENLHLQAQVNPLQREIDGLKKKLEVKGGLSLSELENEILKHLCRPSQSRPPIANFLGVIARAVRSNDTRTRVFLLKLIERDLVREGHHWQGGTFYALTDDGNNYCVEQGWA